MNADARENDVAIVGLALRVPGASTPDAFWRNLRGGVESIRSFSDEELIASGELGDLLRRPNYVKAGAPLERMEFFDGEFFGFGPKESAIMDPQHRHFLECVWEALEDAGHPPERFAGAVAVFAGCGMGSYFYFNLCTNPDLVRSVGMFLLRHTGNDKDFLATRVSYLLNLRGPSVSVQTACSTSLVAVHLASQSLLAGECDMALAGGVTIELPHRRGYVYQDREILSPDGKCRAFDHRAQGTVFGSGVGVVVLRRLKDALADGDRVHAVIRGSAVNNDGASKAGYLAPSVDGQAAAVAEALAVAGVSADSIGYVECHGTGTYLGDPIEIAALTQAFRETTTASAYCSIGSVKSNIGHLDTAAGVVSLIKTCLMLEHGEVPPTLNFEAPNPAIDFERSPFIVADRLVPWPRGASPRLATVNSLGVGGTNAHVVVEEAPPFPPAAPTSRRFQPILLSARNRAALDEQCQRLAEHLTDNPQTSLADASYTLLVGRRAFEHRRVLAAAGVGDAVELLRGRDPMRVFNHTPAAERARVVFMFPGGGVQYPNMARGLYENSRTFRETVDLGLTRLREIAGFDARSTWFPDPAGVASARDELRRPSVQLPTLFILEHALARHWMSVGVVPDALLGHSLGEYTAACLAEVMTFEDALGVVLLRGRLFETVPAGGMLSVPAPAETLATFLDEELDIACINAPELCVISGPDAALERARVRLLARGIEAQRIPIAIAAHSRMLEPILETFRQHLRRLELRPAKIPFLSNRSGTWITEAEVTSPDYWVEHLRNTVRFAACINVLAEDASTVFLEVGPGKVLGSLAKQSPAVRAQSVLPSLRHEDEAVDDDAFFTTIQGRIWALGVQLEAAELWPDEQRRRIALPTYAFQGQRYWIEPGSQRAASTSDGLPSKEPDSERWFFRPAWRLATAESEARPQTWLVFLDDFGMGTDLCARLVARGHEVICVREGDAFYKLDDHEYRLSPEQGREGYEALVRELLASGKAPSRVLHLWLLTERETFRPGSSFFHQNQERGFFSLLFLAQALGGHDYPKPFHVVVLTNGMQRVGEEALPHPEKATVLGPARVFSRELLGVTSRVVDIELPLARPFWPALSLERARGAALRALGVPKSRGNGSNGEARGGAAYAIERELLATPVDEVVALRGDDRFVLGFERMTLPETGKAGFKERGVYLITGGLGGIGLAIGRHLASSYRARLVLVGRTPLPARAEFSEWLARSDPLSTKIREVLELEALGADVLVAPADVTDVQRMREVVDEAEARFGKIDGVIHAAGVLRDGPMLGKQLTDVEAVFAPKVYGTLVLDEVLRGRELDFLVLFSSTSSVVAPPGQTDYVAANAFLNAFAESAAAGGRRVLALSWGIWKDVGMGAAAVADPKPVKTEDAVGVPASGPLLAKRCSDGADGLWLEGSWATANEWVLDEHRTVQGQAVLPGTGYLELVRETLFELEQLSAFEMQAVYFFSPLAVGDRELRSVRVLVEPGDLGYELAISSRGTADEAWERHAEARISLLDLETPPSLDLSAIDARCTLRRLPDDAHGIRTAQEDHLAFGPRWRVLRHAAYAEDEALARLELPERFATDLELYALHPALLDLATGFALSLAPGYGTGASLWVPVSYESVKVYAALPSKIWSWARLSHSNAASADFVSFDISIADDGGRILVEIRGFTMKRLADAEFVTPKITPSAFPPKDGELGSPESSPAETALRHLRSQGISSAEGVRVLERILDGAAGAQIIASSVDLAEIERQASVLARSTLTPAIQFSRPQLATEYVPPQDDIERTLVTFWEELLGVKNVGVLDSFFDLGGHSLIAVRLFAKLRNTYSVDYPISVLFEAPTIRQCANKLRESLGIGPELERESQRPGLRARYVHLVKMHDDAQTTGTPFFLVAGMFGNVLNLRHLAHLVGTERPFYGLQARGLYGDHQPHDTFEEMARDYLAEIRTVQPRGPYLMGGFSGGGIAAYEMARQLIDDGESVSLLVMLDTPLPTQDPLTIVDRVALQFQDLQRHKAKYVVSWARNKLDYRRRLREREESLRAQREESLRVQLGGASHDFHSQVIEAAFYRALAKYVVRPLPLDLALFRPKLRAQYRLPGGGMMNGDRRRLFADNGWRPFVRHVEVYEVPGDHDSMVLEPNVRAMSRRLRDCLAASEVRQRSVQPRDFELPPPPGG